MQDFLMVGEKEEKVVMRFFESFLSHPHDNVFWANGILQNLKIIPSPLNN